MIIILQIFAVLVGLGFLIFIHELGHFLAARMCGVQVLTFSFGFGPDIISHTYKGTKYCIKLIPFGGFVAMAGEDPDKATGSKGEYLSLPWFKKIFIAFLGPLANYILAAIMFTAVFSIWGVWHYSSSSQVGAIVEGGPAYVGGIMPGDTITSIDGVKTTEWDEIVSLIRDKADTQVDLGIERDGQNLNLNVVVGKNPVTEYGMLGISPMTETLKTDFFTSLKYGVRAVITQTVTTVAYLVDKIVSLEKPDISGPVGIMQVIAKSASDGLEHYLSLLAIISVALGLFNLFPIPFVDGGMIVLFLVEGLRKKRIGLKAIYVYNTIGLVLIGSIFIFATYSDLIRLGVGRLFGGQ
jgi:regulator of sigma E protease